MQRRKKRKPTVAGKRSTEGTPPSPPPAPRRRRRLANLANVRRGLADVIRDLEAGVLEPKKANGLVYAYSTLANVIAGSEIERRLEELEAAKELDDAQQKERERHDEELERQREQAGPW